MIRKKFKKVSDPVKLHPSAQILEPSSSASYKDLPTVHRKQIRTIVDRIPTATAGRMQIGIRALFTGPSGTGKTLAARILSAELGMDLYRVDLAAVVNKYIGETEKNLHKILTRAESLDIILLLDEGDSLLGNRTGVKDANESYANLDIDYLINLMEKYKGIAILASNHEESSDDNTRGRFDYVIDFQTGSKTATTRYKTRRNNSNSSSP